MNWILDPEKNLDGCWLIKIVGTDETIGAIFDKEIAMGIVRDHNHRAKLKEDQAKLRALEAAGVDNWEGYPEAMNADDSDS